MDAPLSSTQASGMAKAAASTRGATTVTSSVAASSNPYRPKYRSPGTSRSAATSSERRPEITATTRYRTASAARTSRAPSTGRASSGRATMADSDPSKSKRMPASWAMPRRRRRLSGLRGVISAEVDGDLDPLLHVGLAVRQARDLHIELREDVLRQGLGLDPVAGCRVVDRGRGDRARGAGPRGGRRTPAAGPLRRRPILGEGLVDQHHPPHHEGDDESEPKRAGGQGEVEAHVTRGFVPAGHPIPFLSGPSPAGLVLEPELAGESFAPPALPQATEPAHEHGVVGQTLRPVDRSVEEMVIAGKGEPEPLPDLSLLGAGVLPPFAFEVQHLAQARFELLGGLGGTGAHARRLASPADGSSTRGRPRTQEPRART